MSKRRIIRHTLLLASLAVGLYQAAGTLELIGSVKRPCGLAGANQLTNMLSGGSCAPSAGEAASILSALGVKSAPAAGAAEGKGMTLYSAGGKALSPEEQKKLLLEAERLRPKPKSPPAPAGPAPTGQR